MAERTLELIKPVLDRRPCDQLALAYYVTALKLMKNPKSEEIANISRLTELREIACPEGFSTLREFNQALSARLLELHSAVQEPLHQSVRGGTQLQLLPILRKESIISLLAEQLLSNLKKFVSGLKFEVGHPFLGNIPQDINFSGLWSVRLYSGGHHKSHVHPEGWLSSAYYVSLPDAVNSSDEGALQLSQPPMKSLHDKIEPHVLRPREGSLALFPSYLWHGTIPFSDASPRLTVAFDIAHSS